MILKRSVVFLAVWMIICSGSFAQEGLGDMASFKGVLAKFKLEPLKPQAGAISIRWITAGYRLPARAATVTITNDVASVSLVECSNFDEKLGATVSYRKKAIVKLDRDPIVFTGMGLKANESFWQPLSDIEEVLVHSGGGGRWWFEFAGSDGHKFVYMPNAELLLHASLVDYPRVRDYLAINSYFGVVDSMQELLIQGGLRGWSDDL